MRCIKMVAPGIVLAAVPGIASAGTTGGTMPWDGPLTTLVNNLTGPVATAVAVGAFFVAGAILVFGEDMSAFVRRLLMTVIAVSLLVFGTQILSDLGITGAMI
jgi:type IV secretion system protein VirB2